MHIAVDMDDVLVDFVAGICASVKIEFGVGITPEGITDWDMSKVLNPLIGEDWWGWLQERDWVWHQFLPTPGAIGAIRRLRQQGHYMELLTNKPEWARWTVWKWLGKWRPEFDRVTINTLDDVRTERRALSKVKVTEAHLIIDDKPETCREFVAAGRHALLFDRPHNQGIIDPFFRAFGWSDVLNFMEAKWVKATL